MRLLRSGKKKNHFVFIDGFESGERDCVVEIDVLVVSKKNLLGILAEKLVFPEYFGENWDALNDCLCDLNWIDKSVVILHRQLPRLESEDLKIYLEILGSVIVKHEKQNTGKVRVVFDSALENVVKKIVSA